MKTADPPMARELSETITFSKISSLGWDEGWALPVTFFDAPSGFGEEVWSLRQGQTCLAWRVSGAEVISELTSFVGRSTGLRPNNCNLQLVDAPQRYRASGGVKFYHFYISEGILARVAEGVNRPELSNRALRDDLIMFEDRDLGMLLDVYARRSFDRLFPATRMELEARALLVVERLITRHHAKQKGAPAKGGLAGRQLARVCDAIDARLDADFGLDELAGIAGCSPTHFSRAFKQSMGVAPFRWLQERRVEKAKLLLEQNKLSLAEIALAVGFSAQPQFTTAFGRATGTTPGAWKRERDR